MNTRQTTKSSLKSVNDVTAQCLTSASSKQATLIPYLLFTLRNLKFNEVHMRKIHKTTAVQGTVPAREVGRERSLIAGITKAPANREPG